MNKFSLRFYGSHKALEKERERQEKVGAWIIHPYSNFRFFWDICSLLLLIATMIIVPIGITFFMDEQDTEIGWIVFNLTLDIWFMVDIVINFRTGIVREYAETDVILDPIEIRNQYLISWFIIDVISTLPLDYILLAIHENDNTADAKIARASGLFKLFRIGKLLSLLRLLRLSRLIRYLRQWEELVNMQYDLAIAAIRIFKDSSENEPKRHKNL